ncbi:MAG: cupin domain-containing protein [Candidatus Andersenbacteria bacterium]|nr:cupin domain-containing protein [Candidatus Andersenbacteria bacterium]
MNNYLFKQNQAKKYDIAGGVCYLYPDSPTDRLSCAYVEQDGRYPEQGSRQNEYCTEAMFIIDGEFSANVGGKEQKLEAGDVLYVQPRTPYSIEGKGKTFVFIEPKWNSEQNTQV